MSKNLLGFTKRSTSSSSSRNSSNHGYVESNGSFGIRNSNITNSSNDFKRSSSNLQLASTATNYNNNNSNDSANLNGKEQSYLNDDSFVVEEAHDDCVYQVTIKKVYKKQYSDDYNNNTVKSTTNPYGTYKPLSSGFYSYINDDPSLNNKNYNANQQNYKKNTCDGLVYTRVKVKQLKYATLDKFVHHLTNQDTGEIDSNLVQTFLATYRTFTDTPTVIKKLRARFEEILPASLEMTEDVRLEHLKTIRSILHMWLEHYNEDFNEPPDYPNLNELNKFAHEHCVDSELVQFIRNKFELFESLNSKSTSELLDPTQVIITDFSDNTSNFKLNMCDSESIPNIPSAIRDSNSATSSRLYLNVKDNNKNTKTHHRSYSNLANPSSTKNFSITNLNYSKSQSKANIANVNTKEKDSSNNLVNLLMNSFSLKSPHNSNSNLLLDNNINNFLSIDSKYFAEQLTYIDKCLFQKIITHHCLGSVWGTRYQKPKDKANNTNNNNNSNNNTTSAFSSSLTANNSTNNSNYSQSNGDSAVASRSSTSPSSILTQSVSSGPVLSDKFASIRAFIDQFNCVSFIVQASILDKVDLKPSDRAKIIKKWIEIAQACRRYKNFSSLNAIVQGLNTQCVSRLEKTWNEVPSELRTQFNDLTEMFSQDQNQKIFREILMRDLKEYMSLFEYNDPSNGVDYLNKTLNNKINPNNIENLNIYKASSNFSCDMEGTAKYADINSGINATLSRKMKDKILRQQIKNQIKDPLGTVPFLGTFLKDLEYIHAQNPTKNEKGLINVTQKRKEFEIIAQIKLLQQASQLYKIRPDPSFNLWLRQQPQYSEAQYYEFSYMIEPKFERDSANLNNSNNRKLKLNLSQGSRSESNESINSSNSPYSSSNKTPASISKYQHNKDHSRNSSLGNSDVFENSSNKINRSISNTNFNDSPFLNAKNSNSFNNAIKDSNSDMYLTVPKTEKPATTTTNSTCEMRVKVNIELNSFDNNNNYKNDEQIVASSVVYKQMTITDKYRTKDVKRLILEKFFLNPDFSDKYTLVQILNPASNYSNQSEPSPQNELIIKDNCNVYYAAKNLPNMQFVLRKKPNESNGALNLNTTDYGSSYYANGSSNNKQYQNGIINSSPNLLRGGPKHSTSSTTLNRKTNLQSMLANSNSSNKIAFDQLPPQHPNFKNKNSHSDMNSNGGTNSSSSWQLFKKIF